jgi:hypothetical protein
MELGAQAGVNSSCAVLVDDVKLVSTGAAEVAPAAAAPAAAGSPPADAVTFGGHGYKLFTERLAWEDARRRSEEMGGHLVTLSSKEEDEFARGLVAGRKEDFWIGLSDPTGAGRWAWVTGEPVGYTGWSRGEPNFAGPGAAAYRAWAGVPWGDRPMSALMGFICEWESGAAGANLLVNGGFEDGRPDPWQLSPLVTIVGQNACEGKACLLMQGSAQGALLYRTARQTVALEPGKTYALSFRMSSATAAPGSMMFGVDVAGARQSADAGPQGQWTEHSLTFTAERPEHVVEFKMKRVDLLVDDVRVVPAGEGAAGSEPVVAEPVPSVPEATASAADAASAPAPELAGFASLVAKGELAAARTLARANGLDDAARAAGALEQRVMAAIDGARKLIGRDVELALAKGRLKGMLDDAGEAGVTVTTTYRIGGATGSRTQKVKWGDLAPSQVDELAGGNLPSGTDAAAAGALTALQAGDADGAARLAAQAGDHSLARYVMREVEVARRGAGEVAAEEAWAKLKRTYSARRLSADDAKRGLAELDAWLGTHRATAFARGAAADVESLRARLEAAAAVNYLVNGSFEEPIGAEWTPLEGRPPARSVAAGSGRGGTKGMALSKADWASQRLTAPAGRLLELSFWCRLENPAVGPGWHVESAGRKLAESRFRPPEWTGPHDGVKRDYGPADWVPHRYVLRLPAAEATLFVGGSSAPRFEGDADVWYDDVALRPFAPDAGALTRTTEVKGVRFALTPFQVRGEDAVEAAALLGGRLATFAGAEERDAVRAMYAGGTHEWAWLGARSLSAQSAAWLTGEPVAPGIFTHVEAAPGQLGAFKAHDGLRLIGLPPTGLYMMIVEFRPRARAE